MSRVSTIIFHVWYFPRLSRLQKYIAQLHSDFGSLIINYVKTIYKLRIYE